MEGVLTAQFGHAPTRDRFSDASVIAAMVRVEAALAAVEAELGLIAADAAKEIASLSASGLDSDSIAEGVRSAGVPVPALVAQMRQQLSSDAADALHWGATSQDIVDTALCLCFGDALDLIESDLGRLIDVLKAESDKARDVPMLARTRGQLATPITAGLRIAQWAQPLIALEAELPSVRQAALRVQFGGASGSRSVVHPHGREISVGLARELGLADGPSWHTARSGFRRLANWLVRLVEATGKIGRDLSVSARGEIGEMRGGGGGGSSTMPHKSNPVTAEALQSLVILAQSHEAGLAAAAVHAEERDGTTWPVEWAMFPALFEATGAALDHATRLVSALEIDAEAMSKRIGDNPEALAEAASFALAPSLGLVAAKRLVAEALKAPKPFMEALAARSDFDWSAWDPHMQSRAAAREMAEEIFAARSAE